MRGDDGRGHERGTDDRVTGSGVTGDDVTSGAEEWLDRFTNGTGTDAGVEGDLAALRADLAVRADRAGVLDLAYRSVSSPLGELLLVASPAGIVRIAFETEDPDDVLASLAATVSPRILEAPERLDEAARELEQYFAGTRRTFDVAVDLRLTKGFRASVVAHLPEIEYGHTESYAMVAAAVGNPRAVRAVGSACATNPVPIFIPCHRVVRSDGTFGAYRGGHEAKRFLLSMEAAA